MKITDVEAIILKQDKIEMVGDGSQDTVLILIHTDDGITGIGEVDSSPYLVKEIIDMPASHSVCIGLKELLIGENPLDIERLWNKMYDKSIYYGRRSVAIHAMSGIDIALWDIAGKKYNVPISTLLGGTYRTEISAYCSVLMPDTEDEIKRLVDYHMPKGYKGMKLGWGALGHSFDKDVKLATFARKALGDDIRLMLDIGMMWKDVKESIKTCKKFEEQNVYWVEEPFGPDFIDSYKTLRENTFLHVAGGEEVTTIFEYKQLMDNHSVDIVQPDISRCGGLTVAKKIADIADTNLIQVVPHAFKTGILLAATLQYIASLKNAEYLEFCEQDTVLRQKLLVNYTSVNNNGLIEISQKPGLGIELDYDVVNKYRIL